MSEGPVAMLIRERLTAALAPTRLAIRDDSALHAGHPGAREGGHFHVAIASAAFRGLPPLARHRRVYEALGELLRGRIHALSIDARLPEDPAP